MANNMDKIFAIFHHQPATACILIIFQPSPLQGRVGDRAMDNFSGTDPSVEFIAENLQVSDSWHSSLFKELEARH